MKNKKIIRGESREFRLDELSEKHLESYSQNYQLVSLVQSGVSISAALKRLNINFSQRTVRGLIARYQKDGKSALIDKRWLRGNQATVLTDETKKIILYYFFTYSAAGQRAVWKATCKICLERKLPCPSESSVKKYIDLLPQPLKMFRRGDPGERQWRHEALPVIRYENTSYGNQRWQADHTELPIWVRLRVDGKWMPCKVHLTGFIDAHTRSIPGCQISSKHPDSWSIALALRHAILKKNNKKWRNCGLPSIFQCDRGKDFMSHAIRATLAKTGVAFDPDPPYYPNRKGKMERFFLTLDTGCLRILPGHMKAIGKSEGAALKRVHELLTLNQLKAEIERWIVEDYHERVHSETQRKPAEFWLETARLRLPADDDLNLLILKEDKERTVKNTGLIFTHKGEKRLYWSPELAFHYGERVKVAYNPEDLESVLLYCAATRKFICEAFDMNAENPRYAISDIRLNRSQFRRGLKDRILEYTEEIESQDRRAVRSEEFSQIQAELEIEEEINDGDRDLSGNEEINLLLEEFTKIQRGE